MADEIQSKITRALGQFQSIVARTFGHLCSYLHGSQNPLLLLNRSPFHTHLEMFGSRTFCGSLGFIFLMKTLEECYCYELQPPLMQFISKLQLVLTLSHTTVHFNPLSPGLSYLFRGHAGLLSSMTQNFIPDGFNLLIIIIFFSVQGCYMSLFTNKNETRKYQ